MMFRPLPGRVCRRPGFLISYLAVVVFLSFQSQLVARQHACDVAVYGGTSGGIAAAVQARRMGKSVIVVEPGAHLGGLSSGGLGATDIGNKKAIGGISREFYQAVKRHYQNREHWIHQAPEAFTRGTHLTDEDAMWFFEPHVAEGIFEAWVREHDITVIRSRALGEQGATLDGTRIVMITLDHGETIRAAMYIDASYEGDLMAAAGVQFTVGREANATYGESLNGVQVAQATKHQLQPGIDPFVIPGRPDSGLLFGIEPGPPPADGTGDHRVQAYNLRLCVTDVAENQIPFEQPEGYDEQRYELLFRNFEAGEKRAPWNRIMMPNRKTDCNNNFGFSTDYIGQSYSWPTADPESRKKLYAEHLHYIQGLMWTLCHHPRVPESMRRDYSRWGLCKDEFQDNGGWPHQLYIREARRMVSEVVMTQHHCQGREAAPDSVGLAAYTMDSHHVQRYVGADGFVHNEGDVQVGGFPPYPISYRSVIPRESECTNLLVPVCLSSSHIAFGSIRMEPVFMVLGQSTATAACLAIDQGCCVQHVPYDSLHRRLAEDRQFLTWK